MINTLIIIISWLLSICLLWLFVPRKQLRYYVITFLFSSTVAWAYEYVQVSFGLIEFPFREFEKASKMSFSLHYAVYPTFCVFYILYFPVSQGKMKKFLHTCLFNLLLALYTFLLNKYSSLIEFKHWNFFYSIGINFILLYTIKRFAFWFKKGLNE